MKRDNFFRWVSAGVAIYLVLFCSCEKETQLSGSPYSDPPVPFIKFYGKNVTSIHAIPGDTISFQIMGVNKLPPDGYTFLINKVPAEVVNYKDNILTVKVPQRSSSGTSSLQMKTGEYFYGPLVIIDGKVSVDPDFNNGSTTPGTDGSITDLYNGGSFYALTGFFSDYNNQKIKNPVNSIVKINTSGAYQDYKAMNGATGSISSILPADNGKYIIGGNFGNYQYARFNPDNITQLNNDFSIDSIPVDLVNPNPDDLPQNSKDTVPNFNGYLDGSVVKLFKDVSGKTIAIGYFATYYAIDYKQSQKGLYLAKGVRIRNFIRFNNTIGVMPGSIDSTYNYSYDPNTGKSNQNLDGGINSAIQLANKKIIIAGGFTKFNDKAAPGIMALTDNGDLDPDFAANIGSGTLDGINSITYNSTTRKILITGIFTSFNNHTVNGVAMLNEDGSFDESFAMGKCLNGFPQYAAQLDNSKIIVAGSFDSYASQPAGGNTDTTIRQGFMILEPSGVLSADYNNTGTFSGRINGLIEPSPGKVLLYGFINLFDNIKVGNIVQIKLAQ